MRRLSIIFFVVLTSLISNGQSKKELLRLGSEAYTQQDFTKTSEHLGKYIQKDDGNPEAFFMFGVALSRMNQRNEALTSFTKALNLRTDYHQAYKERGKLMAIAGNLTAALSDFDAAIALQPNYIDAHFNRGQTHLGMKNYRAAAQDFGFVASLNPADIEAQLQHGKSLFFLSDHQSSQVGNVT